MESILVHNTIFNKSSRLVINDDFIEYGDKDDIVVLPKRYAVDQVEGFRYGINWIRGYMLYIGRSYHIDVLMKDGGQLNIRLTSLYSIQKHRMHKEYVEIINKLFETYFHPKLNNYLKRFNKNKILELSGITLHEAGIMITANTVFTWEDLRIKLYNEYFAIFSKQDPTIYKHFNFKNEWNAHLLFSLIKCIKDYNDGVIEED